MNKGKKKCEILKTIRCQVARKNGIPYTYTECTYQGECRGTCPKCEEELRYLTRELEKLKKSGKQVAVAGVAAAVIATSTAGCSSDFLTELGLRDHQVTTMGVPAYTQQEELDGDVAYTPDPEETEEVEFKGDIAPPEQEYELGGEPLPILPSISDVFSDLQQSREVYLGSFERTTIQVEWEGYLTESGEDYDVFTVDDQQIIVTYHEDGWGDSVTFYEEIALDGDSQ